MGQGHLAKGQNQVSGATRFITEAVRRTDSEKQVLRATVLLVTQQVGKFF